MQSQIDKAEAELAHLRVGGAEIAGAQHLLKQVLGHWFAGLEVPREKIQSFALPAPVLHDLRGQLDEIPGHVRPGQAAHFHLAQAVMQQMAELVKNGLDFAMREQRRAIVHRRREIAADQRRRGARSDCRRRRR